MSPDRAIAPDVVSHTYPIRSHFLWLSGVQRLGDVAVKESDGLIEARPLLAVLYEVGSHSPISRSTRHPLRVLIFRVHHVVPFVRTGVRIPEGGFDLLVT
jgi:hypothetical protein